jgi:predicted TPR repeat methyltransferase
MSKLPEPKKALDIGCGEGTYAKLFPKLAFTGVEVWEPYAEKYGLQALYQNFILQDAREFSTDERFDVCFLGDVLEHMTVTEATVLVEKAKSWADTVIISIPIGHYPQDEYEGNPYERHVKDDWSDAEVKEAFGKPT